MPTVHIKSPVLHDGTTYEVGQHEVDDKTAKALKATGYVEIILSAKPPKDDGKNSGKATGKEEN